MSRARTTVVCLDLSGTLMEGSSGTPIEGAVETVGWLRRHVEVRFVTNVTSRSRRELIGQLESAGLIEDPAEIVTPATVAESVLVGRNLGGGILLVDPALEADFGWFEADPEGPAVVLGTEAHDMRVADLQPAFRRLLEGAEFFVLQRNRYFRASSGEMVTDIGPVAAFLAYAASSVPTVLGKPSSTLFETIADGAGASIDELLMVGDDAEFDVSAPISLGLSGVLVRTGKYRPGDEERFDPAPTATIDSIADLPAWLEETAATSTAPGQDATART